NMCERCARPRHAKSNKDLRPPTFEEQVSLLRNLASCLVANPAKLSVTAYRSAAQANFNVETVADRVDKKGWLRRPVNANSDSLPLRIKEELDANKMMIIGDGRANMIQKDWVREISEKDWLYREFQTYFRQPAPCPKAAEKPRSVLGNLEDY